MSRGSRTARELGRRPVARLLWQYSLPAIVGMLALALYNVVDRLYVGRCVGPDGLAGFALTFPPMMVMLAFGLLFGVGTATRISIAMGQGKRSVAQCYLGQAVCVYLILSFAVYPLCALFVEPLLAATGGTAATIPPAADYLRILFVFAAFQYLSFGLNHTLRASGHPTKALMTMLIGAVANIVIDPFFIFEAVPLGFATVPGLGMGIKGAAVATVLSQAISAAWVLAHFLRPSAELRLRWGFVKLYRPLFWGVVLVGLPPFALNLVGSGVNALYNVLFRLHAPTEAIAAREIAAIGIVMTVQMLMCMPVLGVAQGMQPILGFNYGARNYGRLRQTFSLAAWVGGGYIFVCTLLVLLFRRGIFRLFCREDMAADLLAHGSAEMAIFFCGFSFVGYAILVGQYFQSIGRGGVSLTMSLSRQCFLLVPLMLLLPRLMGPTGVWWAAPISDVLSVAIALHFHLRERRRLAGLTAKTQVAGNAVH